jgi:hypothetical protein
MHQITRSVTLFEDGKDFTILFLKIGWSTLSLMLRAMINYGITTTDPIFEKQYLVPSGSGGII